MKHIVFLGLGSNLGDRAANLRAARQALHPQVSLLAESPVYETDPWGYEDQPAFLNQVVKTETDLAPKGLLVYLKAIETQLGRAQTFRYGPREIDLDILFYDDLVIHTPDLIIPHPRMHERAFVLVPLADLAPELRHPLLGLSVREMLAASGSAGVHPFSDSSAKTSTR